MKLPSTKEEMQERFRLFCEMFCTCYELCDGDDPVDIEDFEIEYDDICETLDLDPDDAMMIEMTDESAEVQFMGIEVTDHDMVMIEFYDGRYHAAMSYSYLRAHFADTKNEDLARHLGVDVKTVRRWARRLGLVKSEVFMQESRKRGRRNRARYYTDEQEAWRRQRIAEVYPDGDDEALRRLAEELGVKSVAKLAMTYGIRRSDASMQAFKAKAADRATRYGPDVIERLKAYYPTHTNEECAERFGMSKGSVFQLARRHGIRKTAEHKSRIYAQNKRKKRG